MILRGLGVPTTAAIMHTYIGEMGTKMDNIRKRHHKKHRKFMPYIVYSFIFNGGNLITYGK